MTIKSDEGLWIREKLAKVYSKIDYVSSSVLKGFLVCIFYGSLIAYIFLIIWSFIRGNYILGSILIACILVVEFFNWIGHKY